MSDKFIFVDENIVANIYMDRTHYFTLIDKSGNYLFEPIRIPDGLDEVVHTEKYIYIYSNDVLNEENLLQIYDLNGNKLLETEKMKAGEFIIGDDIIVMYHPYMVHNENTGTNELKTEVKYYDMNFNQLFN